MTFDAPVDAVVATLLVALRITAFLVIAPPFAHRAVPAPAKAVLALALALVVAPGAGADAAASGQPWTAGALLVAALLQVLVGAALGFAVFLLFAAVQAAGDLVDVFGGFQLASAFDPLMQSGSAIFGRLYQFTAIVLLFASDGHLLLLAGLDRTFDVLAVGEPLSMTVLARVLTDGAGQMLVAALQVAGPLIAVLFLTDVGLGLLTRAAPALQVFSLAFPLKIAVTLAVGTVAFAVLPQVVATLADDAARLVVQLAAAETPAEASAGGGG